MKGSGIGSKKDDVVLLVDVDAIHSSSMSGQSEWVEVTVSRSDGSRGVIRIEKRRPPTEDPMRRISL